MIARIILSVLFIQVALSCITFSDVKYETIEEWSEVIDFNYNRATENSFKFDFCFILHKEVPGNYDVSASAVMGKFIPPMNFKKTFDDILANKIYRDEIEKCTNISTTFPLKPGVYCGTNCLTKLQMVEHLLTKDTKCDAKMLTDKAEEVFKFSLRVSKTPKCSKSE